MCRNAFRCSGSQEDVSIWMKKVFSNVKSKHCFIFDDEEILDHNQIIKMISSLQKKDNEKKGNVLQRKKAKKKERRKDKDRQLVMISENSSDNYRQNKLDNEGVGMDANACMPSRELIKKVMY